MSRGYMQSKLNALKTQTFNPPICPQQNPLQLEIKNVTEHLKDVVLQLYKPSAHFVTSGIKKGG